MFGRIEPVAVVALIIGGEYFFPPELANQLGFRLVDWLLMGIELGLLYLGARWAYKVNGGSAGRDFGLRFWSLYTLSWVLVSLLIAALDKRLDVLFASDLAREFPLCAELAYILAVTFAKLALVVFGMRGLSLETRAGSKPGFGATSGGEFARVFVGLGGLVVIGYLWVILPHGEAHWARIEQGGHMLLGVIGVAYCYLRFRRASNTHESFQTRFWFWWVIVYPPTVVILELLTFGWTFLLTKYRIIEVLTVEFGIAAQVCALMLAAALSYFLIGLKKMGDERRG